ncbi:MAG: histidine--tRNA ligase [Endomicrobia bacterium]|nr:histidine--tRNA ligase [Endomicrobiia bacterium]
MNFIKRVRGVRDILPEESSKLDFIISICEKYSKQFGFKKVILPIIENIQLYVHSIGEITEIVEKQMFSINSKDLDEKIAMTLRPEGTAGMVRSYIENSLKNKYFLKRFYYFGSMFRYERPQKGRYREFYQFGVETFEEPPGSNEISIITLINNILNKLNINYNLEINTIGCPECRPNIFSVLKTEFLKYKDNLCDLCKIRLNRNPLRILDCKIDIPNLEKENVLEKVNFFNLVCNNCKKDIEKVLELLNLLNIRYNINPKIVRGLDYYNGFVFEYQNTELKSAQNTICAGGRYDFLIRQLDPNTQYACGAAFGVDRMAESLPSNFEEVGILKIGIATVNERYFKEAFSIAKKLLDFNSLLILGPFYEKSLRSQLRLFNNENCKYAIIVGDEISKEQLVIKNLKENKQDILNINRIYNLIKNEINNK